jgi:signal transduction histidine kinase
MSKIEKTLQEAEEYTCRLEEQLAERTQELNKVLEELNNTKEQLAQSEKMANLGQVIAGVAHEVNTPLGAIKASIDNINYFLATNLVNLPEIFQLIPKQHQPAFFELLNRVNQSTYCFSSKEKRAFKKKVLEILKENQIQESDHIADVLIDIGVYEELEQFLALLQDPESVKILDCAYQLASLKRSSLTITTATDRIIKIVLALKQYAYYDREHQKKLTNIIESIENVLVIYHNQIKHGIEVIKIYDRVPLIWCYPDELHQIWANLISNALQAMGDRGTLTIKITQNNEYLIVCITDSGSGIPREILPQIFQPFFTTKPAGKGNGLGLDIVQKIVSQHDGKIEVDSVSGQTNFTVYLPLPTGDNLNT